jgi:predicted amidophosphoribosyltransferase
VSLTRPDVLDLLLPRRCVVCGRGGTLLCADCRGALPALTPPFCERCGAPTAWPVSRCRECTARRLAFATARAAVAYEAGVRAFVAAWKERGLRRLAAEAAGIVVECLPPPTCDVLTFVPPDGGRRLERGFHPAERLAFELGTAWRLPCEQLLRRTGRSQRQRGLRLAERRGNVAGAFEPRGAAAGRILLVDDVYTSGATASEAARALRRAGASDVAVVSLARTIRAPRLH